MKMQQEMVVLKKWFSWINPVSPTGYMGYGFAEL